MALIRTRNSFCCLPVRYGVLILTILNVLGGVAIAGFGFLIAVIQTLSSSPDKAIQAAFYFQGVVYSFLAFSSLFGFVVAIIKRKNLVYLFGKILFGMLFFSVASGIFSIVIVFYTDSRIHCVTKPKDITTDDCMGSDIITGVMVAVFLLIWGLLSYACVLVPNYAEQLAIEDHSSSLPSESKLAISQPIPQLNTTYNSYTPTSKGGADYAFAEPRQSFGVQRTPIPRTPTTRTPITHTPTTRTPNYSTPATYTPNNYV